MSVTAPDQAARDRIKTALETTLFVEAGAGSGKTTALVDRIVALVTTGTAQMRSIAAITFTEKAAAELRDRVRRRLEEAVTGNADPVLTDRCQTALDELDMAAVGTLHSFALRLLSENPVEAGLPPRIEVLDEVSSGVEFERRWRSFLDHLLEDPEMERALLLLLATGVKHTALRMLAMAFDDNWDLVAERVPPMSPEPPDPSAALRSVLAEANALCGERINCADDDDRLLLQLNGLEVFLRGLATVVDEVAVIEALGRLPKLGGKVGRKDNWPDIDDIRDRGTELAERFGAVTSQVTEACVHRLGGAIRAFTLNAAEQRRTAGRLEFHDLLVMPRSVLRSLEHGPAIRSRLHTRYTHLLLDEFQDTDPIQVDVAVRIAAADSGSLEAGLMEWDGVEIAPGHLFLVGDPKQSIYRFRRADISTFIAARDRFGAGEGEVVKLTANFRTVKPIIEWVNATFGELIQAVMTPVASQPAYVALQPVRDTPPVGAPVAVIGREPIKGNADVIRTAEAQAVADSVVTILAEGWSVQDGQEWRPARLGDITILIPARTSLPFLEDAFTEAGIPYRAESSSLVYSSRAIRDLLMVLRAADDPTNSLRVVSALRTPLLACGDDDLFRFKVERKGHWNYLGDQPDTVPADDPVRAGLAFLRALHNDKHWLTPSELLDRVARERRVFEFGFADRRPRDLWRRVRFVIDQARAWCEATDGGLREYLHWVTLQASENTRVAEAVLPETDDDAVRIMTIHASKGLEFPITIVSGMSSAPRSVPAPAQVVFPPSGGVGYKFGKFVETEEFTDWIPIDEQMGSDERKRLLYVACTRAKDHLIVSLHRKVRSSAPETKSMTNSELLVHGMRELIDSLPDAVTDGLALPAFATATPPSAPAPFDDWQKAHSEALRRASRPTAVAATALAAEAHIETHAEDELVAGLKKRPRDLDAAPWLKGRYGTSVGRAVHGVLQTIDLATGAGVDAAVAAQCEAEAVPDRADVVKELVTAALGSATVQAAAALPHWREVYVCTPIEGGRLLEGYVDLLYRTPDGLMVVDYKTAGSADPALLDERVAGYRLQGAAYALAVAQAAGEPVVGVRFLFLTPDGAFERDLDGLDPAVANVRSLVINGSEATVEELVS